MVRLPTFTADISRHSAVLSPVSIQNGTQFTTYQQRKPKISNLWATMARIWPAPRWLWRVSNVPSSAVPRTRAVISGCTESASRTAGKSSSQSANIIQLDSYTSTSFRCTWGTPHKPPLKKTCQPPAEPRKTDVAGIADLPQLQGMSYNEYDAADESDDLLDLGGVECKPPISLKQTQFSLKQFAKRMGQANYSAFNKWK